MGQETKAREAEVGAKDVEHTEAANETKESKATETTETTDKLADDLFTNHELLPSSTDVNDLNITKYLTKLDEYLMLQQSLIATLQSGFINISRANYSSGGLRPYGKDQWDMNCLVTSKVEDGVLVKCNTDLYNPLNMFGVLVPQQLRNAKEEFEGSLDKCVRLVHLRRELDQLSSSLSST